MLPASAAAAATAVRRAVRSRHLSLFHVAVAFELRGNVDVDVLEWSMKELVRRHEALRTNFRLAESGYVQAIVSAEDAELVGGVSRSPTC